GKELHPSDAGPDRERRVPPDRRRDRAFPQGARGGPRSRAQGRGRLYGQWPDGRCALHPARRVGARPRAQARPHPARGGQPAMMRLARWTAVFALAANVALAADFPAKPVTMIVPYPPGGSNDTFARELGKKLGDAWKVPVIVDNRPGAGGSIGAAVVSK